MHGCGGVGASKPALSPAGRGGGRKTLKVVTLGSEWHLALANEVSGLRESMRPRQDSFGQSGKGKGGFLKQSCLEKEEAPSLLLSGGGGGDGCRDVTGAGPYFVNLHGSRVSSELGCYPRKTAVSHS